MLKRTTASNGDLSLFVSRSLVSFHLSTAKSIWGKISPHANQFTTTTRNSHNNVFLFQVLEYHIFTNISLISVTYQTFKTLKPLCQVRIPPIGKNVCTLLECMNFHQLDVFACLLSIFQGGPVWQFKIAKDATVRHKTGFIETPFTFTVCRSSFLKIGRQL
jgi:hypothetical protein